MRSEIDQFWYNYAVIYEQNFNIYNTKIVDVIY